MIEQFSIQNKTVNKETEISENKKYGYHPCFQRYHTLMDYSEGPYIVFIWFRWTTDDWLEQDIFVWCLVNKQQADICNQISEQDIQD